LCSTSSREFELTTFFGLSSSGCSVYILKNSNVAAAGMFGYIGIVKGILGVPFINPYHLYTFRNPAIIGSAIYGAIGGTMALVEGKTI
jgi:hypothetical protein